MPPAAAEAPRDGAFLERWAPRPPDLFTPVLAPPARPAAPSLLERYLGGDLRPLVTDLEARPSHYTRTQKETLERLRIGAEVAHGAESELLLQYMRRSEPQRAEHTARRRITSQLITPPEAPPPFEEQELFRGAIKLI